MIDMNLKEMVEKAGLTAEMVEVMTEGGIPSVQAGHVLSHEGVDPLADIAILLCCKLAEASKLAGPVVHLPMSDEDRPKFEIGVPFGQLGKYPPEGASFEPVFPIDEVRRAKEAAAFLAGRRLRVV